MKYIYLFLGFSFQLMMSQTDFSEQWEDLYSYNDVKDFVIENNKLYAITNNSMFIYDIENNDIDKFSSVNGLSGSTTSSISFDKTTESVLVGYENGLIELILKNNTVFPITGVRDNFILIDKAVNGFYRSKNQTYIFGDFGISELNIEKLEIGDTFKLSNTDISNSVYQIVINNNVLYAATHSGLYKVDLSSDLLSFDNWIQIEDGSIEGVINLNGQIYFTKEASVYEVTNPLVALINTKSTILSLNIDKFSGDLVITTSGLIEKYEELNFKRTQQIDLSQALNYDITTTRSIIHSNQLFINTDKYGVLTSPLTDTLNYTELHPSGPTGNDIFRITISGNQKWIVYGGHSLSYNNLNKSKPIDYCIDNVWGSVGFSQFNTRDCTKAIVDPFNDNIVIASSIREGIVELDNFKFKGKWTNQNTNFILPGHLAVNQTWTGAMTLDNNGMIWTANSFAKDNRYFSRYNGLKEEEKRWDLNVDFTEAVGRKEDARGFNEMYVDQNNNVYAASARSGLFVFDANLNSNGDKTNVTILDDTSNNGALKSSFISSVAVDENEQIWIGTNLGLVVFDDYDNLYATSKRPATSIIIEEGGDAKEFLGDVDVRDIVIDRSGNKWFGTAGAGLFFTSSDAQTTFNIFTTSNSPLPSNTILDLELDRDTGFLYIVTDRGTLVYDPKTQPFGTEITEMIAYPNPAVRTSVGHETVTFVTKDGSGIPDGTNIKIVDVSGRLVFETNVLDNGQPQGGKFVWDKKNLRGNLVASGIYIVLFSNADGTENTTTKIAIVN